MTNLETRDIAWLPNVAFLIIALTIGLGLASDQRPIGNGKNIENVRIADALLR